jgi:hypothetical protein
MVAAPVEANVTQGIPQWRDLAYQAARNSVDDMPGPINKAGFQPA